MNMFKKNGGFTLVELIVVIAILAILAAVAVPAYSGYINSANEAADTTALAAVKTAAMATYATEGAVTKIVVTDAGTSGDTIQVWLNDDEDAQTGTATNEDFLVFMNADSFDITLKTGNTASWDITDEAEEDTKGEWVIETGSTTPTTPSTPDAGGEG